MFKLVLTTLLTRRFFVFTNAIFDSPPQLQQKRLIKTDQKEGMVSGVRNDNGKRDTKDGTAVFT